MSAIGFCLAKIIFTDLRRASELEEVDHVLLKVLNMTHRLLGFGLLGLLLLGGRLLLLILLLLEILSQNMFQCVRRKCKI